MRSHTHSHSHSHSHSRSRSHSHTNGHSSSSSTSSSASSTPRKRKSPSVAIEDDNDMSTTSTSTSTSTSEHTSSSHSHSHSHSHPHVEVKESSSTNPNGMSSPSPRTTHTRSLVTTPLLQLTLDPTHLKSEELISLSIRIFTESGCLEHLPIPISSLTPLLDAILYTHRTENGYHNQYHAFHVLLNTYRFLYQTFHVLPPIDIFGVLLSAVCHDLDHCGISNRLLIERHSDLATLYADKSPLEQNSIDKTLAIITDSNAGTDIISHLNTDDRSRLVTLISDLIMATDITDPATTAQIKKDWTRCVARFRPQNANHRCALLRMTLMCADIGVVIEPFDIFISWAGRLLDEIHLSMELHTMTSHDFHLDRNRHILQMKSHAWMRGRQNAFLIQHQQRIKQNQGEKITIPRSVFSPSATSHTLNTKTDNNNNSKNSTSTSTTTSTPAPPPANVPPTIIQFYEGQIKFLEGYARPLYTSVIDSSLVPALTPYLTCLDRNTHLIKERGVEVRETIKNAFIYYNKKRGVQVIIEDEEIKKNQSEIKIETKTTSTPRITKYQEINSNGNGNGNGNGRASRVKSKR